MTATPPFNPISIPDYMAVDQLRELQLIRMQKIVKRAYDNVSLFRSRMDKKGLKPEDIQSLDDVKKLPFTVKGDLMDTYPNGMFASPMSEIVRLHASSGTTGKPTVVAYTKEDIDVWSSVMARTFACCTVHPGDIMQNAYGYGLFTGGLGAHYGAEKLGATVIPISGGNSERQIMLMKDMQTTVLSCTPSYFTFLIEHAEKAGTSLKDLPLRVGIFGAEPWTDGMRKHIEEASGIKAFDIYGLSEIIGPGVGSECEAQHGLHIFEDHFYPEIIDPETEEVLPDGEEGELVLTTLSKMALPMIRYRTRDMTRIIAEPCSCGRTIRKIEKISRRSDDMFIIRGVNVFPSQIETALLAVEGTVPHYQIVLTTDNGMDNIEVQVEVTPAVFSDKISAMENLRKQLNKSIENVLGIRVETKLVAPQTIQRSEGKAKRVIDQRSH